MRFNLVSVAFLVALSSVSGAQAQSVAEIGGPREVPPSSFSGQQYVDSRGCVFLRAGYGGQVNWVPRVTAQRRALCGFPPTFGGNRVATTAPAAAAQPAPPQPAPAPQASARRGEPDPSTYLPAPVATSRVAVAPAPAPQGVLASAPMDRPAAVARVAAPAPYADRAPAGTYEAASAGPGPGKIGCFTSAPVAEVVRLRTGGTAVVCTRGDGGVSGWRSPIYPAGAGVGAALSNPVARVAVDPVRVADGGYRAAATTRTHADVEPKLPKGYRAAWTDDRLNPNRGKGTAAGQAAQDQIWTREVPSRLVADVKVRKARVTVSTKSVAAAQPTRSEPARAGGALVQVGTFGVASNADGAAARLAALGLPVAKGRTTRNGKTLQVVFAGPFGSSADAQSALSMARRAGFSDAFLR